MAYIAHRWVIADNPANAAETLADSRNQRWVHPNKRAAKKYLADYGGSARNTVYDVELCVLDDGEE